MKTVEQLQQLPIDQLDRMAFGVQQGIQELPLDQIQIQYQQDYDNALDYVEQHPTAYQDALQPGRQEPVEVQLESGVYWLQDGHHRYVTAQVLGLATILVDLTIKDNPVKVLVTSASVTSPYDNIDSDIRDALEHVQDEFDVPFHEDIDPSLFTVTRVVLTLKEIGNYDDPYGWLDAEPGELVGASHADVLAWARAFRPQHDVIDYSFVDTAATVFDTGVVPAVVIVDTPEYTGLGDGRGRYNLAVALGLETIPAVILTLRDNPVRVLASRAARAAQLAEITCTTGENQLRSRQEDQDDSSKSKRGVTRKSRTAKRNTVRTVRPVLKSRVGSHGARSRLLHERGRDRSSPGSLNGSISGTRDGGTNRPVGRLKAMARSTPRTGLAVNFTVTYTRRAEKNLRRLNARTRRDLEAAILIFEIQPRDGDGLHNYKALTGYSYLHSVRAGGDYRIVYAIFDQGSQVEIQRVEHRSKVYKNLHDPVPPHLRASNYRQYEPGPLQHRRTTDQIPVGNVILFTDDPDRNRHYGDHVWTLVTELPLVPRYVIEFAADHYEVDLEEAEELVDPPNIVDTAAAWDDPQFVYEVWAEFEDPGYRTYDGAVVLDRDAVELDYHEDQDD